MNFFEKHFVKIFMAMTPGLLDMARSLALHLYEKAMETDNPLDDTAAILLLGLLGESVPVVEVQEPFDPTTDTDPDLDLDPDRELKPGEWGYIKPIE